MLIEFGVTNFCQFSGKQTLSMVSDNTKELQDSNTFLPIPKHEKVKLARLLNSAGVYGPNASGKSNLLTAMNLMKNIVLTSNCVDKLDEIIPNFFHKNEPTEFQVIFIANGVRYQYGFATNRQLIMEEWLFAFPSGRAQQWLSRVYVAETQEYKWYINPTFIKGDKKHWIESTPSHSLFLSTVNKLNIKQFDDIYQWFNNINISENEITASDIIKLNKNTEKKTKVLNFLQSVDLDINDFVIETFTPITLMYDVYEIVCSHKINNNSFKIPLSSESNGTQQLIKLAVNITNSLDNGSIICIDDLGLNLHPYISNFLVTLFNDPETNPNHAQLIFTSHDTTLLDTNLLRRDQVWFIEKDDNCSSHLYPLTDFKPRPNTESLYKGY